jgi:flavin-binding protein dodecin
MEGQVYKLVRLTGAAHGSMEAAIRNALERSSATVRNMRWFKVVETRGAIEDGGRVEWQVTIEVGFRLEER